MNKVTLLLFGIVCLAAAAASSDGLESVADACRKGTMPDDFRDLAQDVFRRRSGHDASAVVRSTDHLGYPALVGSLEGWGKPIGIDDIINDIVDTACEAGKTKGRGERASECRRLVVKTPSGHELEITFTGLEIAGIVGWLILVLEIVVGVLFAAARKYGHPRHWCNGRKLGRGPAVHSDAPINRPNPEAVEAARNPINRPNLEAVEAARNPINRQTPEAVEAARYLAESRSVDLMTPPSGPSLLDLFDETCASYMPPPRVNPYL